MQAFIAEIRRLAAEILGHPIPLAAGVVGCLLVYAGVKLLIGIGGRGPRSGYRMLLFLAFAAGGGVVFFGYAEQDLIRRLVPFGAGFPELVVSMGMTLAGAAFTVLVLEGFIREAEHKSTERRELEVRAATMLSSALFLVDNLRDASVASFRIELNRFVKDCTGRSTPRRFRVQCRRVAQFYSALHLNAAEALAARRTIRTGWRELLAKAADRKMPESAEQSDPAQGRLLWEVEKTNDIVVLSELFRSAEADMAEPRTSVNPLVRADPGVRRFYKGLKIDPPDFVAEKDPFPWDEDHSQEADSFQGAFPAEEWPKMRETLLESYKAGEQFERLKSGLIYLINVAIFATDRLQIGLAKGR